MIQSFVSTKYVQHTMIYHHLCVSVRVVILSVTSKMIYNFFRLSPHVLILYPFLFTRYHTQKYTLTPK